MLRDSGGTPKFLGTGKRFSIVARGIDPRIKRSQQTSFELIHASGREKRLELTVKEATIGKWMSFRFLGTETGALILIIFFQLEYVALVAVTGSMRLSVGAGISVLIESALVLLRWSASLSRKRRSALLVGWCFTSRLHHVCRVGYGLAASQTKRPVLLSASSDGYRPIPVALSLRLDARFPDNLSRRPQPSANPI